MDVRSARTDSSPFAVVIVLVAILITALLASPTSVVHGQDSQDQEFVELTPELDARAAKIEERIMCPQCSGQTISQSRSPVAQTMRLMVRQRLAAGDTDEEIYAFMVEAFGQSVLASPPTSGVGLMVWVVPPVALLLGGVVVFLAVRRLRRSPEAASEASTTTPETSGSLASYLDLVDREMQGEPNHG